MLGRLTFAEPYFLAFLLIIPLMLLWYIFKHKNQSATLQYSSLLALQAFKPSLKTRLRHSLLALRLISITLIIIAIARPQTSLSKHNIKVEGIDIVLANDISGSMLAEDFKPNRLEAAKQVANDFITGRPTDRIGLVVFSGESFTQCPITTNHATLLNLLDGIKSGMIEDGTAIGDGLATAINRLKESKAISKVIILLTDGVSNMGAIDPATAAEIAKIFGIRVYTIGVGTYGMAPYPFKTPYGIQYQQMKVEIDEALLQNIADVTGAKYFRATNKQKLKEIYSEIDQLEKSKIDVTEYKRKKEEFLPFLLLATAIFIVELLLRLFVFKTNP